MDAVHNFFRGIFSQAKGPEAGDSLPDEVTTLVLSYLSSIRWIATCQQVCRKWNRLGNMSVLWEIVAKQYCIAFSFKSDEQVTVAFKKQIYQRLSIEMPAKTREDFFNKIKSICSLMKSSEIGVINYTSARNVNAYFKILVVRGKKSSVIRQLLYHSRKYDAAFNEVEKTAQIYRIHGEKEADFSSENVPSRNLGACVDGIDLEMNSCWIELSVLELVLKEIKAQFNIKI